MTSIILVNVLSLLLALDCVSLAFIAWHGRRFLRNTPCIDSTEAFLAYRGLVATCMKATFIFIMLLVVSFLIGFVGLSAKWIRMPHLEPVVLMGVLRILGGAVLTVNVESRLKQMPTAGLHWEFLKQRVVELWDAEPWPREVDRVEEALAAWQERLYSSVEIESES